MSARLALAVVLIASPALAQTLGDAAKGAVQYENRCTLCHGEGGDGQGPDLKGVVGRKAGTVAGYPYSAALTASGVTWTPANLDKFLAGPDKFIAGAAMPVAVPDQDVRADIIAYLATLKP